MIASVDTRQLDARFAGRDYDASLLADLPPGVDPCGERGEFHSFVHDGPIFARPIPLRRGGIRSEGRFAYAELELAG